MPTTHQSWESIDNEAAAGGERMTPATDGEQTATSTPSEQHEPGAHSVDPAAAAKFVKARQAMIDALEALPIETGAGAVLVTSNPAQNELFTLACGSGSGLILIGSLEAAKLSILQEIHRAKERSAVEALARLFGEMIPTE